MSATKHTVVLGEVKTTAMFSYRFFVAWLSGLPKGEEILDGGGGRREKRKEGLT